MIFYELLLAFKLKKNKLFRHCTGNNISFFLFWSEKNVFCKNHPVCISDFKTWTCGIMQSQIAHPPPQWGPLWLIFTKILPKIIMHFVLCQKLLNNHRYFEVPIYFLEYQNFLDMVQKMKFHFEKFFLKKKMTHISSTKFAKSDHSVGLHMGDINPSPLI